MALLEQPVIRTILITILVLIAANWLLKTFSPKARKKDDPRRRLELDGMINKLSRKEREDIKSHMADGRKILAIKYFRAVTGARLRDAKEAVERMSNSS